MALLCWESVTDYKATFITYTRLRYRLYIFYCKVFLSKLDRCEACAHIVHLRCFAGFTHNDNSSNSDLKDACLTQSAGNFVTCGYYVTILLTILININVFISPLPPAHPLSWHSFSPFSIFLSTSTFLDSLSGGVCPAAHPAHPKALSEHIYHSSFLSLWSQTVSPFWSPLQKMVVFTSSNVAVLHCHHVSTQVGSNFEVKILLSLSFPLGCRVRHCED